MRVLIITIIIDKAVMLRRTAPGHFTRKLTIAAEMQIIVCSNVAAFFFGYEVLDHYVVYSPTHGEREIIVHAIMLRWTPSEVWSSFAGRWCNNLPCTCDSVHTRSVSRMYIRVLEFMREVD